MFTGWGCNIFSLDCQTWPEMKDGIFQIYLDQGKAPWVFATYISDLISDFGDFGAAMLLLVFYFLCVGVCRNTKKSTVSLSRLSSVLFLFLVPYWGVFYFRFGIVNGYIVVNLLFIAFIFILQLPTKRVH